jgi:hypothetical protein
VKHNNSLLLLWVSVAPKKTRSIDIISEGSGEPPAISTAVNGKKDLEEGGVNGNLW